MNDRLLTAQEVADLLAVPLSWVREATRRRMSRPSWNFVTAVPV